VQIVGLSGSLRRGSYNTALLRAVAKLAKPPVEIAVHTIEGIPVYDGDVESERGLPDAVVGLKGAIAGADGLILVTPEYNHGVPGPLKNAIDWCSRPPKDQKRVFGGRPVAICGATIGRGGTALSQAAWLPTLRVLGLHLWPRSLQVSTAHDVFDDEGRLTDEKIGERLADFVQGFAAFCAERAGRTASG